MSRVKRKKPALLKAEVFRLVDELREFLDTANAVDAWLGELPRSVLSYLNQMYSRGTEASTRRERLDALWCGDCWFFRDDDNDRLAARDWVFEVGDEWLRRDPRKRLRGRDALREVRRILSAPERSPD